MQAWDSVDQLRSKSGECLSQRCRMLPVFGQSGYVPAVHQVDLVILLETRLDAVCSVEIWIDRKNRYDSSVLGKTLGSVLMVCGRIVHFFGPSWSCFDLLVLPSIGYTGFVDSWRLTQFCWLLYVNFICFCLLQEDSPLCFHSKSNSGDIGCVQRWHISIQFRWDSPNSSNSFSNLLMMRIILCIKATAAMHCHDHDHAY